MGATADHALVIAGALVERGYLLPEDAAAIVERARTREWPPRFD